MTHDPHDWTASVWRSIDAAPEGVPALHATLRAARSTCDLVMPAAGRTSDFDPATAWAFLDGLVAGLELATGIPQGSADERSGSIDDETARALLDRLLRRAADICLSAAEDLRQEAATSHLRAVAGVARQLPETYRIALGQPW